VHGIVNYRDFDHLSVLASRGATDLFVQAIKRLVAKGTRD
jgi:hypothetical protein